MPYFSPCVNTSRLRARSCINRTSGARIRTLSYFGHLHHDVPHSLSACLSIYLALSVPPTLALSLSLSSHPLLSTSPLAHCLYLSLALLCLYLSVSPFICPVCKHCRAHDNTNDPLTSSNWSSATEVSDVAATPTSDCTAIVSY